jgi:hypothetical protein
MSRRTYFPVDADEYQDKLNRAMSEDTVQAQIVEAAQRAGFTLIYHTWNSQHSAAGFPDLVMLHRSGRMVVVECKREGKEPTAAQWDWLRGFEALTDVCRLYCGEQQGIYPPMVAVYIAKPSNRQAIIDVLATYAML